MFRFVVVVVVVFVIVVDLSDSQSDDSVIDVDCLFDDHSRNVKYFDESVGRPDDHKILNEQDVDHRPGTYLQWSCYECGLQMRSVSKRTCLFVCF